MAGKARARGCRMHTAEVTSLEKMLPSNGDVFPEHGSTISRSTHTSVMGLAALYIDNHPGRNAAGTNRELHEDLSALLAGRSFTATQIDEMICTLEFRTMQIDEANILQEEMKLRFPACSFPLPRCESFDFQDYDLYGGYLGLLSSSQRARYSAVLGKIIEAEVFTKPEAGEGFLFTKPRSYTTICVMESGLEWDDITDFLIDWTLRQKLGRLRARLARVECYTTLTGREEERRMLSDAITDETTRIAEESKQDAERKHKQRRYRRRLMGKRSRLTIRAKVLEMANAEDAVLYSSDSDDREEDTFDTEEESVSQR